MRFFSENQKRKKIEIIKDIPKEGFISPYILFFSPTKQRKILKNSKNFQPQIIFFHVFIQALFETLSFEGKKERMKNKNFWKFRKILYKFF